MKQREKYYTSSLAIFGCAKSFSAIHKFNDRIRIVDIAHMAVRQT